VGEGLVVGSLAAAAAEAVELSNRQALC